MIDPAWAAGGIQKVVLCKDKAGKYCGMMWGVNVKVINKPSVYLDEPVTVHNDGSFAD